MIAFMLNASAAAWPRACPAGTGREYGRSSMAALEAWIVPNTRWPVSAACMAALNVSRSRISPTRMMSGSCRTACFSAVSQSITSMPDLALVDDALVVRERELDRVFDGDDVQRSLLLMYWSIEAIVVLLPDPVTPARMIIPWSYWVISARTAGRWSSSKSGIDVVDPPGHQAEPAALLEQVDAEAGLCRRCQR